MNHETIERIHRFTEDRDWQKFHTPANLAKSISIEANELLECFQWSDTDYDIEHVKEELADVLVYCRNMLDELELDEDEIVNAKMDQNDAKYPVEKAKGSAAKYTSYEEREVSSVFMRMPGHLRELLKETQEYLLSLGEEVEQNNARRYYSYKLKRVFAVVIPDRTRVIINLRIDPKKVAIDDYFARDLHGVHSYGPASLQLQLFVRNEEQLEDAKKYMKRAFEEYR